VVDAVLVVLLLQGDNIRSHNISAEQWSMQCSLCYCCKVTSSTDRRHRPTSTSRNMDDRLSMALNSVCVADAADDVGFLESLSSLSMDSTTHPSGGGALSPTSLLSENSRPPRAGPTYLDTTTSNMVVNDMDTSLTQLQAEETKYYMTVRA